MNVSIENKCSDRALFADRQKIEYVITKLLSLTIKRSAPRTNICIMSNFDESEQVMLCTVTLTAEANSITASHKPGSEFNLSACKKLMESHKGTMGVEQLQNNANRFWFSLLLTAASPKALPLEIRDSRSNPSKFSCVRKA